MPTKYKNIEVSAKRPLFGGESEMDKEIAKWTAEGWELVNTTASKRKNYYLLSFEYEPDEDEEKSGASRRGMGCAVGLGVIVALALVCNVINSGSLGNAKEPEKPTLVVQAAAVTKVVKPTELPRKDLSSQTSTVTVVKTDIVPTSTAIPTRTLPTATPEPTAVFATVKSGNINARSCASTDCAIVGTVISGEKVSVIGQQDNWYLVELDDKKAGYVRSDLLSFLGTTEVASLPTPKTSNTVTPTAFKYLGNEAQDVELIKDYLNILTDNRRIVSVKVANGRSNGGERVAIIGYVTVESSSVGYLDEMLDIFEAIYEAIDYYTMDIDSITLVGGDRSGSAVGAIGVSVADLVDYFEGHTTREEFVGKWTTTSF